MDDDAITGAEAVRLRRDNKQDETSGPDTAGLRTDRFPSELTERLWRMMCSCDEGEEPVVRVTVPLLAKLSGRP